MATSPPPDPIPTTAAAPDIVVAALVMVAGVGFAAAGFAAAGDAKGLAPSPASRAGPVERI